MSKKYKVKKDKDGDKSPGMSRKELTRIEGDIKVQEEINKLLREEADGLKERHEALQLQHQSVESQFQALQCEYDKLQLEYDSLKAHHDALNSKCIGLGLEHNELLDQHRSLVKDHHALQEQHRLMVKLAQLKGAKVDELRRLAEGWKSQAANDPRLASLNKRECGQAILAILNPTRYQEPDSVS